MRVAALVLVGVVWSVPASAKTFRGLVFDDTNGDGRPTAGEASVPNAVVAYDVKKFVTTNAAGEFTIDVPDGIGNGIIWVRVPDGYRPGPAWARVPADDKVPVEIGLHRVVRISRAPTTFVITADTHLTAAQPFANDLGSVALDAVALDPAPAFFTVLGDITQNNEEAEYDLVDANLAGIDVPYVPVPGNHDWYDGGLRWFKRYGPDNYSFDIDNVHFVVWNMSMREEDIALYLGDELSRVAPEMTVIAMTHAPPVPRILAKLKELGVDFVLSGHTHTNRAVVHGDLVELTTEPLLMGGLDLSPAGYRVATIDKSGKLSTYHRTVLDDPLLAVIAPGRGGCIPPGGGPLIVAAEFDASTATIAARVDCATPIAMRYVGGWNWRADLPRTKPGSHVLLVDARTPSGQRVTRTVGFDVCEQTMPAMPSVEWSQIGGSPKHAGAAEHPIPPPLLQRWAATVGGQIMHAAPAIAGTTVYVSATDQGDGHSGGVVSIDLATGQIRWRVATATPVRGSPAITNGVVAVGQLDGTVLGLDAETGELRWDYELGLGLAPEAASLFAAPAADGGDFLIGNQRHLAALASDVGAALWRVDPVPGGSYSQSLASVAVGDGVAVGVFHRDQGGVVAWDRATGAELWRARSELTTAINATPVISGDTVYIVNGATEVVALSLFPNSVVVGPITLNSGEIRWTTKLHSEGFDWGNATVGTPAIATPAGLDPILVVPTMYRDLVALDAKTGAELWRFAGTPSPLRTTHYRGASESGFEASPVITGDIVWTVDTAGRLSALALATGHLLWQTDLDTPVLAGLAVAGDWLVVASYDGSVRAFTPGPAILHHDDPVGRPPGCDVLPAAGCCDVRGDARASLGLALVIAIYLRRRRRPKNTMNTMTAAPPDEPVLHS